jgi:hypothetical protein
MSTTKSLLARVRTRMALAAAVESLERGAAWGAGTALAALVCDRIGWTALGAPAAAAAGCAVALAFPAASLVLARRDDRSVAAAADERLGLAERLSTALWCQQTNPAEAALFAPLVVADAESAAARVRGDALGKAFRPRTLRRSMIVAAVLVAAAGAVLWSGRPGEPIAETEAERIARLADADRLAEVARKIQAATKRVEAAATEHKESELAKVAAEIQRKIEPLTRAPSPPHEAALRQLNALADLAREQARRAAGMQEPLGAEEASEQDKALEQLLEQMSAAGLESLQKDLKALEDRLKAGEKGEKGPSASDVRALANRLDSLRKAMERAASGDTAAKELLKKLRSVGNEELLAKIAERLRQIAARMDRGEQYSDLQGSEADAGEDDLSQMSEEELKKLLAELDQLAGMKDLEKMLRNGNGELRGGRKLRLDGAGGT